MWLIKKFRLFYRIVFLYWRIYSTLFEMKRRKEKCGMPLLGVWVLALVLQDEKNKFFGKKTSLQSLTQEKG